ncbi:MAG: NAD(P)H-dependent oxidoreductase [Arenicellales bacterium]
MGRKLLVIDGHPDPADARLCHALAKAYVDGARRAGHDVSVIRPADLDFTFLHSKEEFEKQQPVADIRLAQQAIEAADHLVLVYPLWMGTMPALLKAFLEQVLRPGFAFGPGDGGSMPRKRLGGRSARIVVTMGMPVFVYRWYFRAHGLKSLERNILKLCGIKPVRESLFGMVEASSEARRAKWLRAMRQLGTQGR